MPDSISRTSPWLTLGSAMLTPNVVLQILKDGNERFVSGNSAGHDVHEALKITAEGQSPFAAVVSCIDSRVPVETVFDLTIGHAFSARVAGNVVGPDIVGSLEFACAVAGSRLIVILGHTGCGAVKGACDGVTLGSLTGILDKIQPAVAAVSKGRKPARGGKPSADDGYVDAVAEANVVETMRALLEQSPILADLIRERRVGLVGAMYDVRTGHVAFLNGPGDGAGAAMHIVEATAEDTQAAA
ncbi:MAG TPA: carbonic anhydrase family protein [Rubricoccaceae bacterium]|jgi:carbonic anhydrase